MTFRASGVNVASWCSMFSNQAHFSIEIFVLIWSGAWRNWYSTTMLARPPKTETEDRFTIVKSDRHNCGSDKHYRENVHRALKLYGATDGAVMVKKAIEDAVIKAWAEAKHPAVARMFS
jgi:hypothetical protein